MKIKYFVDMEDAAGNALAKLLVENTSAEIVTSRHMRPVLWIDGVCYYEFERIKEKIAEILKECTGD